MNLPISQEHAQAVLREADLLCSEAEVQAALDRMAEAITARLGDQDPVVLVVMNGALIPAGHLLTRLHFPFKVGYLHATRYRGDTRGGELYWVARPSQPVEGRVVLVVDDIFDEGLTLKAILDDLRGAGVKALYSAVLVNKRHERKAPGLKVDFVGLEVPDRYVFGCGMDYKEYWRNLPGIYAVKEG
ncbi:MAG TPA: hypoxanthine-guanine phosphoribosyltransferase [Candidatus Competibacteraceae bacterium]|nr:hypoxanthine-guanine phosphoribosyltransferase [Candidatus Competibacteraceae bacterium]